MPRVLPTGTGPWPEKLLAGTIHALLRTLAAWFQWARVGSDFPANRANAIASYQLTPATGSFSFPAGYSPASQVEGPVRPVRSVISAIACRHGIVLPSLTKGSCHRSWRRYPPLSTNALKSRFV